MKASSEKLSTTTSTTATQAASQPFFAKADGGNFFLPITQATAPAVQMKMAVNKPGDKFEQEADQMADKAIRMPNPEPVKEEKVMPQMDGHLQRKEADKNNIMRKGLGLPEMTLDVQATIQKKTRGGEPLPEDIRQFAESRLRADFSMIRIHQDDESVAINQELDARAFTFKQHIFFGRGQFRPGSSEGKMLLAHELVHTLQQGATKSKSKEQIQSEARTAPTESLVSTTNKPQTATKLVGNILATTITSEGKDLSTKPKGKTTAKPSTTPKESSELPVDPDTPVVPVMKSAPKTPKEDLAFEKVMGQTRRIKKGQKAHQEPEVKKQAAEDAAHLPENDQNAYNDRKQHLASINQIASNNKDAKKKFTAEQFKELLQGQLDELEKKLPHSEDDTERFKKEKPLEEIKNNVKQQVKDENQKVAAPISTETQKPEPPKSGIDPQTPKPLVEEKSGTKPGPINPVAAAPKPKADPEISMEKESRSLDELMEKNHNTEEQFAESNEPKFQKALTAKKDAQVKASAAPAEYRGKEQQILSSAQKEARKDANTGFGGMFDTRGTAFTDVFARQSLHDKEDKDKQKSVKTELERIYNGTKTGVETIFTELSTYVEGTFEKESNAAKAVFEKRVENQLEKIHGWGVKDFFFGEDTEAIEDVFVAEKKKFLNAMDTTLNTIAQRIADDLNKAVECIQKGRDEAETFYNGLDDKQKELAKDSIGAFRVQFDNLESGVDEKQTELAHSLAESYKQNVDSLRKTFDKINEDVRKTWIQRAAEFVIEVATTIYNLGKLLVTVLVRIAHVIGDILAHPIRFLENLASGIKQGFDTFMGDFDGYLLTGFFDWLRGKVGGAGIKLPPKFDTAGLFSLALQVIGLTYENFRNIAKDKLGEPVVAAIEKGVEGAQEVYKLLQLARQDIGAFWTHIKEMLANTVDELFEKIKKTVLYETIKKVLVYVATLFNPVGAFIKAAQAIYAGIRFLMDNIERIVALVNAFLDGVEMAVKGNVSGIAAKVIFGLQNAIVLGIDFLAKLLNLGNLAEKVRTIIKQLKTPVERAMGFVVDKILKPVVVLVKKAGAAVLQAGVPQDPNERLRLGLEAATRAVNALRGPVVTAALINPVLTVIKVRYGFKALQPVESNGDWWVEGEVNPRNRKKTQKRATSKTESDPISSENIESEPPKYETPNSVLGGVEMTANFLTPKHPKGSGVSIKPPIMDDIPKTRDGTRLYVQGHLLNRLLGGPGDTIKNLTPLTYKANGDHERNAESEVKTLVNDKKMAVKYVVKAHYPKNSKKDAPNEAEGLLATKLTVSWHTWDILSLNPIKKKKGSIDQGPIEIDNVPPWPHN